MEANELARFNVFWFLWLLAPMVIMLPAAYVKKRAVLIAALTTSLLLTYSFSNLAIVKKWEIRLNAAVTEEQIEAAAADGANKVFTRYFFAPIEAAFFTWIWYWIGSSIWRSRSKRIQSGAVPPRPSGKGGR